MKSFRFSSLLVLCLLAGQFAFANRVVEANSELRKAVAKMIEAPQLSRFGIAEAQVYVHFMVNENNEIVVLDVLTDNEYLKEFVANSLNKHKVNAQGVEPLTKYSLKVAFRSEKAGSL